MGNGKDKESVDTGKAHPTLTLKERDRRWNLIKGLMEKRGLDCLIVAGLNGREQFESYVTNDYVQGIVIFPLHGKPIYLVWTSTRITRHVENILRGGEAWVDDLRVGVRGEHIVTVLREQGFDSATIGVVGLESWSAGETEGYIPYKTWAYVLAYLPNATYIDISQEFAQLCLVKSEEELDLVRYCARIGEMACETMLEVTTPGISESEIYANIMKVIFSNGACTRSPHLILATGVDNTSWGPPMWIHQPQPPRLVQRGDIVMAELFPCYGGFETQQQMTVALKPVHPVSRECAEVARHSYEEGLKALCPGKTFREVADAMEVPIVKRGYWHLTPLIHSLAPMSWVGHMNVGIEQLPGIESYKGITEVRIGGEELVIKPGMVFELEPNACRGKYRVNIGGSVIVTKGGVEELNKLPAEMRIVN